MLFRSLLGLDRITTLTHHLETHFERLRSGRRLLDTATMNVVLRCIDFLRDCNTSLRQGEAIAGAGELLDAVKALEAVAEQTVHAPAVPAHGQPAPPAEPAATGAPQTAAWRVTVGFRASLPMAEMKAELILTRLGKLGGIDD